MVLILSFWIISPYDENSVEYMLRDKVIKTVVETVKVEGKEGEKTDESLKPSAPPLPDESLKPSAPFIPVKPSAPPLPKEDIIVDVNDDQLETEKRLNGP